MASKELFRVEDMRSRREIASYLHRLAEKMEEDGTIRLRSGEDQIQLRPPQRSAFELVVLQDTSLTGKVKDTRVELALEWEEDDQQPGRELEIE